MRAARERVFHVSGITDIINAGAATLGGVYQTLTGRSDGWQSFIDLINLHYPSGATYSTSGNNLFPVPNVRPMGGFTSRVTAGSSLQIFCSLDEEPPAEVSIGLVNDDPALLIVPTTLALARGTMNSFFEVQAAPVSGPPQWGAIHASFAGQTLSTEIVVEPRQSMIVGTVSDASGILAGAVVVVDQLPMPSSVHQQLMTGGDGLYSTSVVPPSQYRIEASASGHVDAEATVTLLEGVPILDANIVLPVAVPFTLNGSVSDQAGAAIAGASLTLQSGDGHPLFARTDAAGRYSLSQEPGPFIGKSVLKVTDAAYTEAQIAVTISNGATLTEEIQLSQLGSLTGMITDGSGTTPVPMATVQAGTVVATSDATGRYHVPGLPPGPTAVTVRTGGFEVQATTIPVGAGLVTTQNFALVEATAKLTGTVVDPDGTPIDYATVEVAGAQALAHTHPDGTYTVTGVPAGGGRRLQHTVRGRAAGPDDGGARVVNCTDLSTSHGSG